MRRAEQIDPELNELTVAFSKALAGDAHVQLFVTARRTHGFAWHYDDEDVFIVQTAGIKDYYFRENTMLTVGPTPPFDFSTVSRERSPLQTARLIPGDWLYIPRLWWHMARSVEDALSISVGVR